jgi:transcription initiation factor TFIIE subunit alpha
MGKVSNKVIKDVVIEVAGKDVLPLVDALKTEDNQSEFKLAEVIKQEINTTRNMLYRLHSHNLVSFIRKKDKLKGWYIYYWTFKSKEVQDLLKRLKKKKLERLEERLIRENENHFFLCQNTCARLDFEQATDIEFKCPECGQILHQQNNQRTIEHLKKEISKLNI